MRVPILAENMKVFLLSNPHTSKHCMMTLLHTLDSEFCLQPMACLENFCSNRGQFSDKMYENGLPQIFINALLLATDSLESI